MAACGHQFIQMRTFDFRVVLEPDEDFDGNQSGWRAFCPALEGLGGSTWGESREAALNNINEVVRMIVEELIEEGKPLPEGPLGAVEVKNVSEEEPHILVTV